LVGIVEVAVFVAADAVAGSPTGTTSLAAA
jgi:hypothetical protein